MPETAVVFVRIGWMKTYRGTYTQELPQGGGKNNELGLGGGERDNFLPDAFGYLHGYFAIGRGSQNIDLFRIDGRPESRRADEVSPVLVIFVAPHPDGQGAVIVGWYGNARLYRGQPLFRVGKVQRVETRVDDAVLIPYENEDRDLRKEHRIPRAASGTSGLGQSNIFYMFDKSGQRRSLPWAETAIKYVTNYSGEMHFYQLRRMWQTPPPLLRYRKREEPARK